MKLTRYKVEVYKVKYTLEVLVRVGIEIRVAAIMPITKVSIEK